MDEALVHALAVVPSENRTAQLGTIAEAQAAAGNVEAALRIAQLIPSDQASRIAALRSIAGAQARRGMASQAKETFTQAYELAEARASQLGRAEVLYSLAQGEAEAGMAAEATNTFEESLKLAASLAETPEILASSPCVLSRSAESKLDGLLKGLAEQQARAGSLSNALRAARSIKYILSAKAEALRAIAEIQAQNGLKDEAGLILKDAMEAAHASPIEYLPSCPNARQVAYPSLSVGMLCDIAKAQAKAGLIEDAAATLGEALQLVPSIKDSPLLREDLSEALAFLRADLSRSLALSVIATAQNEAGFTTQSAATFERAMQAASEVKAAAPHIMALIRLGRAQYQAGHITAVADAFDDALTLARKLENNLARAHQLLNVLEAKVEVGLAVDGDSTLVEAVETAQSTTDASRHAVLLQKIALAQEKMGHREEAAAMYREALEATDVVADRLARRSVLMGLILGTPLGSQPSRLIAESAAQVARIAQSIGDELGRSSALVVIARALPN